MGRIVEAVKELGLAERTWIIFTSDNGPWLIKNKGFVDGDLPPHHGGSAGPLRSGKVSTWEGGVRVPAIAWAPGPTPRRRCEPQRCSCGVSFAPIWGGGARGW